MIGLYYISFSTNSNPPFVTGDIVRVFYDEIADVFLVTKNGDTIITGPNLGPSIEWVVPPFVDPYLQTNWFASAMNDQGDPDFFRPGYQFCELTSLVFFVATTTYPYAAKNITPNHPSCVGNVCDIIFRGTPQLIPPTEPTTPDGQITIVAESSIGIVKYSFENIPYASMPNTTGVFAGLIAGIYTIYAKDSHDCTLTIVVNLKAKFNYGVRWRLQYTPTPKSADDVVYPTRIDLLEKDYSDIPIDVKAVDESFVARMRGDNLPLFSPIMSTETTLQLLSETNLQYLPAFTQNDRRFQQRYQKDFGSGFTELLRGWVKPGLYRETYTDKDNYAVNIETTDGTANFSKLKFSDASGNQITGLTKVIEIIATILKKTDLDLPIHVGDNLYETTMSSLSSADPTDQTYIIPDECFDKETTCDVVLLNLLGTKGARIVQWAKAWWIIRIDEMVSDVTYRIFDKEGVLQSDSIYSPLRIIADKPGDGEFTWINGRQDLEVYPAVGVMTTRHNLQKVPNGIKDGGFDKITFTEVIDVFGGKNFQITGYKGWSLVLNGSTGSFPFISGATKKDFLSGYGETNTSKASSLQNALTLYKDGRISKSEYDSIVSRITGNDLPNYAMIFGGGNAPTYGNDAYVISDVQKVVYTAADAMKFGLDYFPIVIGTEPQILPPFIKFKISFKLDDTYYLQADGSWSTNSQFEWIEVVVPVSKFNQWNHIDIAALFPSVAGEVDGSYVVKIMTGSFPYSTWIIGNETALRAVPTVALPEGYKIATKEQSGVIQIYRFYEIVSDTLSPDNSPSIIRPNDYATFDPPSFNILATYNKGDKVKHGGAFFYVSTHNNNKGRTPGLSPADWVPMAGIVVWKLMSEIQIGINPEVAGFYGVQIVTAGKFDNANFEFYPQGEISPESKDYKVVNDDDIDNDITQEYSLGDAPVDIHNAKNIYQNIYRTASGVATIWWSRRDQAEKQQLLSLLAKQYVEQLQRPRFKLSGDLSGYVNFIDSFQEKGRKFIPMSIEIRDYNNQASIEMIEITAPGQNNAFDLGEFKNEEFGTDFDI